MIGKAELAKALGWSRPRLDRRLESDKAFPVENRNPWQFDLAKVKAYLDPPAIDRAQLRDVVKPLPAAAPVVHAGEGTAKQRKDTAQAELLEHKLQQIKDEHVPRAEVTALLANALMVIGKGLDALPDAICRVLGLPESAIPIIREMIDDLRRELAGNLRTLLANE